MKHFIGDNQGRNSEASRWATVQVWRSIWTGLREMRLCDWATAALGVFGLVQLLADLAQRFGGM